MANQKQLDILKQGVKAWNKWKKERPDIQPYLKGVKLTNADLREVNFAGAMLEFTDLTGANLGCTKFIRANLTEVNLTNAKFEVRSYPVNKSILDYGDLDPIRVGWTVFGNVGLSQVQGLHLVKHIGPSTIGIDTILRSQGKIPEDFLRNAGVPDSIIEAVPSLVGSLKPIDYYSCFISYSSKDEDLARRLYADLQSNHVRCWFAPEDLKIGAKIPTSIDESIRLNDKLLLILSQYSVASQWIEQEVERVLARERKEDKVILFPIRLDQAVMDSEECWPALVRNTRNIDARSEISRVGYKKAQAVDIPKKKELLYNLKHPATGFLAKRDALLMCLLLDHGLRVGEIAILKRNAIALRSRLLTSYRPKVDEPQTDRMTDDTPAAARAYLATMPAKQESLFDMALISIQERVRTLGELARIQGLSPHNCRHSWATRAASHGTPLDRLRQAVGWRNIQTPLRYIRDSAIVNEGVILE